MGKKAAIVLCSLMSLPAWAGEKDDLSSMKASMESMKQEMESMRETMASEHEALRANAGGAPESLKSANGKATIKISGDFKVRYNASWENAYGNNTRGMANSNDRYTRTSWDIYKALIGFAMDFTPDTMGYIGLRPDRGSASVGSLLDEAWWRWNNIGGTGFSTKVGLQTLDVGMYNGERSPWSRVMILDPLVKTAAQYSSQQSFSTSLVPGFIGNTHEKDLTALGVNAAYQWDQLRISAGVYGQQVNQDSGMDNTLGVTSDGTARNLDLENHYITLSYDPCWLEGLHTQASYFGEFDQGQGAGTYTSTPNTTINSASASTWLPSDFDSRTLRGANYIPGVDFGISYIADKWAVYAEGVIIANPAYYRDSVEMVYSVGADYALTEKLKVGGSFDWESMDLSHFYGNLRNNENLYGANTRLESYALRGALGARYDFGNGLYVQAQYYHMIVKTWGYADSNSKDIDAIAFQTGFHF